jgi:CRISPR-associated protein Cas1
MSKRIIYIGTPHIIKTKDLQLVLVNADTGEINLIPIEDISVLELDNPQITITSYCLRELMDNKVVIIQCDFYHHPSGMMVPISASTLSTQRTLAQSNMKSELKSILWKSVIENKIRNQTRVLKSLNCQIERMNKLLDGTEKADKTNREAQAAKYYWKNLFEDFSRDPDGDYPNNLLNYGYSLIRAVFAREIVAAGLVPALGIYHKNKYNSFCLADDLMEPYRQFVDMKVYKFCKSNPEEHSLILTKKHKKYLLEILTMEVEIEHQRKSIINAVQDSVMSFVKSIEQEKEQLIYPIII